MEATFLGPKSTRFRVVSIHASVMEATGVCIFKHAQRVVSIHASVMEATRIGTWFSGTRLFRSTPP